MDIKSELHNNDIVHEVRLTSLTTFPLWLPVLFAKGCVSWFSI